MVERLETGGVNRGHVAQSEDDHLRQRRDVAFEVQQLVRAAEQKRTVNAINRDLVWNVVKLEAVPSREETRRARR